MSSVRNEDRQYTGPLPSPVTSVDAGIKSLQEVGYAIHEGVFSPAEVAALRSRLLEQAELEHEAGVACYEGGVGWRSQSEGMPVTSVQVVDTLVNKGRVFIDAAQKSQVTEYRQRLLTRGQSILEAMFAFIVNKGAKRQTQHVDQAFFTFETPIPVGMHVLLCLTDFEEDMGATRLVPGSHLWPLPQLSFDEKANVLVNQSGEYETIPAIAPAGSLIMYDTRLHHGRGAHSSEKARLSLSMGFGMSWKTPFHNYPALIHDDVYASLNEADLQLLGFGSTGMVGPRAADDNRVFKGGSPGRGGSANYVPELSRNSSRQAVIHTSSR